MRPHGGLYLVHEEIGLEHSQLFLQSPGLSWSPGKQSLVRLERIGEDQRAQGRLAWWGGSYDGPGVN
jgi:hypothetical protein